MSKGNQATWRQATHTLSLINQQDPSLGTLEVLHDGYLADIIQAIQADTIPNRENFRKVLGLIPLKFEFTVNYGETRENMISRGKYGDVSDLIFQVSLPPIKEETKKITGELITVEAESCRAAEKQIRLGLKPYLRAPTLRELLSFGAAYPEVQFKFGLRVIALIGDDWSRMPWICGRGGERAYRFINVGIEDLLDPKELVSCRFLGIRE